MLNTSDSLPDRRSVTVRDLARRGRLTLRLLGALFVGRLGAELLWPDQWLAAAVTTLLAVAAALVLERRNPDPVAWQVDATGLHTIRFGGRRLTHAWSSIREVMEQPREILVRTDAGPVVIPRRSSDAEALLQRLRERDLQPASQPPVSPERVAEWLGLPLDGQLAPPADRSVIPTLVALTVLLGAAAVGLALVFGPICVLIPFAALSAMYGYLIADRQGDVTITPHGFYHGRKLVGCWADVAAPLGGQHRNQLQLPGHAYVLAYNQRDPVANAIARIMEARAEGVEIDRLDGVPDTALSLATSRESGAELGLSRAPQE